jgi:transaldolase
MNSPGIDALKIKIFADGADLATIQRLSLDPRIKGFTTNPSLMRAAGVRDYREFGRAALRMVRDRPISFEVLADDLATIGDDAREIASWGPNVYVKIPVTTTRGEFCGPAIAQLASEGIKVNVTAVLTLSQVARVRDALAPHTPAIVSVFAGRIADTGRDPASIMDEARAILSDRSSAELLWASPRELLNLFQADAVGCHIITLTADLFKKLDVVGKDLDAFSRETVAMFRNDALAAGYELQRSDGFRIAVAGGGFDR